MLNIQSFFDIRREKDHHNTDCLRAGTKSNFEQQNEGLSLSQMRKKLIWTTQIDIRNIGIIWQRNYSTYFTDNLMAVVWGCGLAISYSGRTNVALLSEKQNYKDYTEIQNSELLLFACDIRGENWIFQQDGATIYAANIVKKIFSY